MRIHEQINEQLGKACSGMEEGFRWPGMSYEQGVETALMWVNGDSEDKPTEDD